MALRWPRFKKETAARSLCHAHLATDIEYNLVPYCKYTSSGVKQLLTISYGRLCWFGDGIRILDSLWWNLLFVTVASFENELNTTYR